MIPIILAAPAFAAPPSAAFDLSALDAKDWARLDALNLEKRVVLRLMQEGFAVVTPSAGPELLLRVTVTSHALELEGSAAWKTARREVELREESLAELHLEIAQKAVSLARAVLDAKPAPAARPSPELVVVAPPPSLTEPPRPAQAPRYLLGVHAGVLPRSGGTDLALGARARVGRALGFRGAVTLYVSRGTDITVLEARALAGIGYRFRPHERIDLEAGALIGGRFHTWFDATQPGLKVDFTAGLPLSITWWPHRSAGFTLEVTPGATTQALEHPGWARGPWSIEAVVALQVRW
ncbi:MAG: hypothetical protein AMXMBFR34_38040 [Myxococcaceae bacterium]